MSEEFDNCWNRIGVRGDQSCERLSEHAHCRNCDVYTDAAQRVMRRDLPQDYRREWTAHFAAQEQAVESADRSALVFRIGEEWLALPSRLALAIAEPARVRRLPHRRHASLMGIVNVQGRLYPCMSLAALLQIGEQEAPPAPGHRVYPRMMVMQFRQQAYALPVQDLHGIHRYSSAALQAPPASVQQAAHRYLTGILNIADMKVGCLDAELIGNHLANALR